MGANRVIFGNETLMDISEDTVNENNLLLGATAHDADGNSVVGAVITHDVIDNLTSTSTEDALSANQGKVLNESKLPINNPTFTGILTNRSASSNFSGVTISGTSIKVESTNPSTQYTTISQSGVSTSSGHSLTSKADSGIIANTFDVDATYSIGDICYYNRKLWRCLITCTGQTPTEGTYWTQIVLADELPIRLSQTLSIGNTSLEFIHPSIVDDSNIRIFTSKWNVIPTDVIAVQGKVTLTFAAQTEAIGVRIEVT